MSATVQVFGRRQQGGSVRSTGRRPKKAPRHEVAGIWHRLGMRMPLANVYEGARSLSSPVGDRCSSLSESIVRRGTTLRTKLMTEVELTPFDAIKAFVDASASSTWRLPCEPKLASAPEFDRRLRGRYSVPSWTLAICMGCSWNGRPGRDARINPLEAGQTTLPRHLFVLSRAGLRTSRLKAPFPELTLRQSRSPW